MIIDKSCTEAFRAHEFHFHDDYIHKLEFNQGTRKLHLSIRKYTQEEIWVSLDFEDVIAFEITACNFWGYDSWSWEECPRIMGIAYLEPEECVLIPRIKEKLGTNETRFCPLKDIDTYMETETLFATGDKLRIVCRRIVT